MDHFLIFLRSDLLLDVLGFQPFHAAEQFCGKVHEASGQFFSILIDATDRIPGIELAGDLHDSGCQQALPPLGEGLDGPLVDSDRKSTRLNSSH